MMTPAKRKILPLMIWLGTMGLVAYLWSDVGQRSPILGFAQGIEHRVAPTVPGKIQSIAVQLGQEVSTGQVIATLDSQAIDAEIHIEKAELQRAMDHAWANLPSDYAWLRDWEYV